MAIDIRPAGLDDLDGLMGLYVEIQGLHHEAEPDFYLPPERTAAVEDWMRKCLESDTEATLVASTADRLAGFVQLEVCEVPADLITDQRRFVHVRGIAVTPSHKGAGVGRRLMHAAADWARAKGVTRLELVLRAFNADAMAFYDRLGFVPIAHRLALDLEGDAGT